MVTAAMTDGREELYRRLLEADAHARLTHVKALDASTERGAIVEALVMDGASLQDIGSMLGTTRQAVHKMLARHYKAAGRPAGYNPRLQVACPVCGEMVSPRLDGRLYRHGRTKRGNPCRGSGKVPVHSQDLSV